jgi:hypothetical protein
MLINPRPKGTDIVSSEVLEGMDDKISGDMQDIVILLVV